MRKLSAILILVAIYFPLAFATMTITSVRPWMLDRGFYQQLVDNEHLYEAFWAEDLSWQLDGQVFTAGEQLPLSALNSALREVVTPDYLRTQSVNIVNDVFDYIEGRERNFELALNVAPIKAALTGTGKTRFATALAAALPACNAGQPAIASHLTRCIAADGSVEAAAEQIAGALPAVLEDTPDRIIVESRGYIRMNWYDYAWFLGSGVHAMLDLAILTMIVTAAGVGVVGAYLGGDDLRGRLKWFSSALFAPAALYLVAGLVLVSPYITDAIRNSMTTTRWGVPYSETFREAITNVVVPLVHQIGSGVLLTGGVAFLIALALLILSMVTPATGSQTPRIVQIPVRDV